MNQISLPLRLKARGLEAVESSNLTWVETMRKHAKIISLMQGSVTADDVRRYSREIRWQPESPNAFGAVFKPNGWKPTGWTQSQWPSNHGRAIRVWVWTL